MKNGKIYSETFAKQMEFLNSLAPNDIELIRLLVTDASKQSNVYVFPNNENKHEVNIDTFEYIDFPRSQYFENINGINSDFSCTNIEFLEAA